MEFKPTVKKVWWFLWESDSIWSWIVNFIIAFILVKFVIYPGLGYLLGTSFPVVAVVSGSMEHDGNFDDWWQSQAYCDGAPCTQEQWYANHAVSKETFETYRFKNGFNKGDIMVLVGIEPKTIKTGDVIVFMSSQRSDPIIHRLMIKSGDETSGFVFQTKGDHNVDSGEGLDTNIQESNIMGKAVFRIPYLGWIKIGAVSLLDAIRGQ
ncbi:signal peptidase I [Candidatus Woesearchaeota archaeon]|nr:signal peptidase I [Candidatus Woesearchaeota archaeon]